MSETVEGKVSYTADDLVRHATYMQNRNFVARNAVFFALAVLGCILLFFYFSNPAKFTTTFAKPQNILVLVIPSLFLIAWWFLKKKSPRFLLRRSFAKQIDSSPVLREPQFVIFDDEGLYATSRLGSGQTKWNAMLEVSETEDDFLFFTTSRFALFVPKRFFTDEQLAQIKRIAKRNLGEKAKF